MFFSLTREFLVITTLQVSLFLLVLLPVFVFSYNVDTSYPIVHTDPGPKGSNYFGYSVSLSSGGNSQPSLLVGAPRTSNGEGRVYRCTENNNHPFCEWIEINPQSAPERIRLAGPRSDPIDVITGKPSGMGSVISTRGSMNFTVCAPYSLINTRRVNAPNELFLKDMRGYCYNYDLGNILHRDNDILKTKDRYPFNVEINALYGFSANHAAKEDAGSVERIIGQPKSNKVEIKHGNRKVTKSLEIDELSNLGYSVSSGYFFNNHHLLFVAGAPGWLSRGKVMIYDLDSDRDIAIEGSVLGEYFGSSLATGDFDGDGLDDLAVGAPHWGEVDFGRVYTFYKSRDVSHYNFRAGIILQGVAEKGEFGYTMATGDLDSDGYSDLVVSAPWENSGVVYVYYGHSDFSRKDSSARIIQRIEPSQFRRVLQVQRFGFSLSNFVDIDENGYPDFAIGAYKSGQAFVLRSKPVIETEVKLTSNPIALTKSTPSFVVSVCVKYHGKKAPNTQVLQFEMSADADYKRVENGSSKIFTARFSRDQMGCGNQTIVLKNGIRNFVDPIVINVKHSIKETVGNEFCPSCPVLSRRSVRDGVIKPLLIPFNTGCKNGIICNANLSVSAKFSGTGLDNEWVVGSGDIRLNLAVRNDGEPAYVTELTIDLPPRIRLRSAVTSCKEDSKEDTVTLFCDIDNPLAKGVQKNLSLILDMERMAEASEGTVLTFNVTRRTRSVDHGKDDSLMSLNLTVKNKAYLTLTGVTDKKSIDYGRTKNTSKVLMQHTYRIVKAGTTPITEARLTIDVPTSVIGRNDSFLNIIQPKLTDSSGKTYDCLINEIGYVEDKSDWYGTSNSDKQLLRKRRATSENIDNTESTIDSSMTEKPEVNYDDGLEVDGNNSSALTIELGLLTDRTFYLNCSTNGSSCVRITCLFSLPKTSDDDGNVALKMVLDADTFYNSTGDSLTLIFNTNASVEILRPRISDDKFIGNTSAVVSTMLYNIPEPQKLAGWIIPSSIGVGILLFCILAVILFTVGFFDRPKKVDMAKAKGMRLIVKEEETEDERYG